MATIITTTTTNPPNRSEASKARTRASSGLEGARLENGPGGGQLAGLINERIHHRDVPTMRRRISPATLSLLFAGARLFTPSIAVRVDRSPVNLPDQSYLSPPLAAARHARL
jgi:hypothetical protein